VWIAWLRLPAAAAWRLTQDTLAGTDWRCARSALAGLPSALLRRHVVPEEVQRMFEARTNPRVTREA